MDNQDELNRLAELRSYLSQIVVKLDSIKRGPSVGRTLILGAFSGAGYLIGGILIVIILGLVLNAAGIIPGFSRISEYVKHVSPQIASSLATSTSNSFSTSSAK